MGIARAELSGPGVALPWRWALGCAVLGLLAALLLRFPAHWLTGALERASGERIALVNVQGTLWDGSAQLVLRAGPGSRDTATLPGRLAWRLRPGWEAASPVLQATLSQRPHPFPHPLPHPLPHQGAGLREPLRLLAARTAGGGWLVTTGALDWHGPAALLRGLGTPWNTLAFEGDLRLQAQGLQLRQTQQAGLQWQGHLLIAADALSSRISTVRPLGSYRMELQGQAGRTALALSTTAGVLQLQGEGDFVGGQLRFQGSARAAPERHAALGNVLNLIGNRHGPVALRILR